ncbi:Protein synthesis inhibitor I [Panicum miliaceum]|uniref:Protein synthesis inhibitor I n=1 Tax=Panicum miliaceum TaxID=4540 RepID=A0A3L6TKZ8_PANMI|nr:Protein synthesis inhibitor I [Panicum miliaceum]
MALHTKLVVVAVCLAAMALASAGGVACRAVRRGRETAPPAGHGGPALPAPPAGRRHATPPAHAGGHGHDGIGGGIPLPAPAAAPLPAPVDGRDVDDDDQGGQEIERRGRETAPPSGHGGPALPAPGGRHAGGHGHDGTGGGLPPPAPAAAPVDGRSRDAVDLDDEPAPPGAKHQQARGGDPGDGSPVSWGAPPTWILIQLVGSNVKEKVTLAVRDDNAYVAGFNNGGWFAFPRYQRQIDGSTALPRREDYPSLIGGSNKLVDLDVNRDAALEAVRFLSTYRTSDDVSKLGVNLARLCVIVAEAARFRRIYNTVLNGFQQQEHQARLAVEDAKSVVLWGEVSRALVAFNKTGKWIDDENALDNFKKAGMGSPQEAIRRQAPGQAEGLQVGPGLRLKVLFCVATSAVTRCQL